MCRNFLAGSCPKDDMCAFAHNPADLVPPPDFSCTRMCKRLVRTGTCNVPDCKWAHSQEELRRRKPNSAEVAHKKERKKAKGLQTKLAAATQAACEQSVPTQLPALSRQSTAATADLSHTVAGLSTLRSMSSSPTSTVGLSGSFYSGSSSLSDMNALPVEITSFAASQILSGLVEEVSTPADSSDTSMSDRDAASSMIQRQSSECESAADGLKYSRPMCGTMIGMQYRVNNTFLEFQPCHTDLDADSSSISHSGRPNRSSSVPLRGCHMSGSTSTFLP